MEIVDRSRVGGCVRACLLLVDYWKFWQFGGTPYISDDTNVTQRY